jgi:hypothetical protein
MFGRRLLGLPYLFREGRMKRKQNRGANEDIRAHRKPRTDGDSTKAGSVSSPDASDGNCGNPFAKMNDRSKGMSPFLPDLLTPLSPPRQNIDLDHGRHVPHLICSYYNALKQIWEDG